MADFNAKYIIVGAGLSGLVTARDLARAGETDFLLLEGRDRLGGRIHTQEMVDLGATWFQDHHQHLAALLTELDLARFPQFNAGRSVLVYSSMAPPHFFEQDQSVPAAARIAQGSMHLIDSLAAPFLEKVRLRTVVREIAETTTGLRLETDQGSFVAEKVVVTLPPKLAAGLQYAPALPTALQEAMHSTHTWMSNAIKVGIRYAQPFWRENQFSGTIIGQLGPTIELYDHTDASGTEFGLMGFVNEGLRDVSAEARKERILAHIEQFLGPEVRNYTHYLEKDWAADAFTSASQLKSVYMSPQYGNPLFSESYAEGRLYFSGAETSPVHGGYMDGAVFSGARAAKMLLEAP